MKNLISGKQLFTPNYFDKETFWFNVLCIITVRLVHLINATGIVSAQ